MVPFFLALLACFLLSLKGLLSFYIPLHMLMAIKQTSIQCVYKLSKKKKPKKKNRNTQLENKLVSGED